MFLRSALVTIFALPALISGSQIPVVNGVVGGVSSGNAHNSSSKTPARSGSGDPSARTPGKLRGVVENSCICEKKGIYQASGYGDLTSDKSVWFWFFAARHNPDKAPLITWFNGGPGSSSMLGLFQENGPCRINNDSLDVHFNPMSWNEFANVLYIDQPVGAGFSYGTLNVDTSDKAAVDVWKFLQIWFEDPRFKKYACLDFGIWTESYGGHYGPIFAKYFLDQNDQIKKGTVKGEIIKLKVLGIGNGLTDPLSQYPGYIEYATSNPWHSGGLVGSAVIAAAQAAWINPGGCKDQINKCNSPGWTPAICSAAQDYCNEQILSPLADNWDYYYVPVMNPDPYPPQLNTYLSNPAVISKIGSKSAWQESNNNIYYQFALTGDWMRSALPALEAVIDAGVRTVIYAGDADYIVNYMGVEDMVNSLTTIYSAKYATRSFRTYNVRGRPAGLYKNAGKFSYLRVFGAGHEVPAYKWRGIRRGEAALQMFEQIMSDHHLSST